MAEESALQQATRYVRATATFYKSECHPRLLRFCKFIKQKHQQYEQYRETQKQIAKDRAAQEAEATRKRQAEIEEEQAAARRAAYDPEAAIEDMRLAYSYLQDCKEDSSVDKQVLGLAAKYIELARTKDQNAKLTVDVEKGPNKGTTHTYSLDELSATALFYESQQYSTRTDATPKDLQHARDLLTRAIAYYPYYPLMHRNLAKVYLNLHDKQSALAVAKTALTHLPKNMDARKLLDFVQAAPETQAPTVMDTNPSLPFLLAAFTLGILGIIAVFTGNFSTGFGLVVVAFIVGWIGNYLEKDRMLAKALEERAKERAGNR